MEWLTEIRSVLEPLFDEKPIVLVDVGASGAPPDKWRDLSYLSCYVGFDPDSRDLYEDNSFGFRRFIMFNKAMAEKDHQELDLYLTAYPHCSSTLKPNMNHLSQYSFTDLFAVEKLTAVPAISLESALRESHLEYVDWIKLDTQGKDLDIIRSFGNQLRSRLLDLDIEPGVVDFYEGEKDFSQADVYIQKNGFWLSEANFQKYARVSKLTRDKLASFKVDFSSLPGNPTAVEARYFRTLDHLASTEANIRDYVCLWIFSMLNCYYGFALDVAVSAAERGSGKQIGDLLIQHTLAEIERRSSKHSLLKRIAKSWVPSALHPLMQKTAKLARSVRTSRHK